MEGKKGFVPYARDMVVYTIFKDHDPTKAHSV